MRSVADDLRARTREADARLTPAERVERALRLGDDDLQAFAARHRVSLGEARRRLSRQRQLGRRPSPCASGRP
jgi:multidrug resistance efflux pump